MPTIMRPRRERASRRAGRCRCTHTSPSATAFATTARLTGAGYLAIGLDHFARPDSDLARALADNSLQRNFQGYSTYAECDLLGVGMSRGPGLDAQMD